MAQSHTYTPLQVWAKVVQRSHAGLEDLVTPHRHMVRRRCIEHLQLLLQLLAHGVVSCSTLLEGHCKGHDRQHTLSEAPVAFNVRDPVAWAGWRRESAIEWWRLEGGTAPCVGATQWTRRVAVIQCLQELDNHRLEQGPVGVWRRRQLGQHGLVFQLVPSTAATHECTQRTRLSAGVAGCATTTELHHVPIGAANELHQEGN